MQKRLVVEHSEHLWSQTRDGSRRLLMRWELSHESKKFRSHVIHGSEHYRDLIEVLHELVEGDNEVILEWWDDWDDVDVRWHFTRRGEIISLHGSTQPAKKELTVSGTYAEICLPFWEIFCWLQNPFMNKLTKLDFGDKFPSPELDAWTAELYEQGVIESCLLPRYETVRYTKPEKVSGRDISLFRDVTGLKFGPAIEFLQACSPTQYTRIMTATVFSARNNRRGLRDPLEEQEKFGELLALVRAEAKEHLQDVEMGRGFCFLIWETMKQILREKYRVEWFSPAEMNPWVMFD